MTKHERYRRRLRREGKCEHCGRDAFPYLVCARRRFNKRVASALRRLVSLGMVTRISRGVYQWHDGPHRQPARGFYHTDPNGAAPKGLHPFLARWLGDLGRPASTEELTEAWRERRRLTREGTA